MILHEESVVTLISAILGSSALGGIGGWMAMKLIPADVLEAMKNEEERGDAD